MPRTSVPPPGRLWMAASGVVPVFDAAAVTDFGPFGPFGPPLGGPQVPCDLASLKEVIRQQRGLVTTQQCLAAGLSDRAIRHRLRTGRWVAVRRGVYQTVPGRVGWWWESASALLSVGSGAAWAFGTAGFAHGLLRYPPRAVHLLVDASVTVEPPGRVVVHRSRHAAARVDDLHWPWRTSVDHTILDLAELGSIDDAVAVLARAFQRGVTTEATMLALLAARPRHRRRALLHDVLAVVSDGAESAMEVRFARDVERAHGLPRGRRQAATAVKGVRLHDVAYDEQRPGGARRAAGAHRGGPRPGRNPRPSERYPGLADGASVLARRRRTALRPRR